ncbi:TPA: hypothetical protein ACP2SW_000466 [Escherichia coli]
MKQMSLIEMDGFLKGKCFPRDLKVNETNAEYLVRKFAEAEAKISALSEDHQRAIESIKQADAAVKLAHEKFSALAAENAALKSEAPLGAIENGRAFAERLEAYPFECQGGNLNMCSDWQELRRCFEYLSEWAMHSQAETPATDAFLAEVRARALEYYANLFKDTVNMEVKHNQEFHKGTLYVADQIRKGASS